MNQYNLSMLMAGAIIGYTISSTNLPQKATDAYVRFSREVTLMFIRAEIVDAFEYCKCVSILFADLQSTSPIYEPSVLRYEVWNALGRGADANTINTVNDPQGNLNRLLISHQPDMLSGVSYVFNNAELWYIVRGLPLGHHDYGTTGRRV